jgi:hypothetical protein
MRPFPQPFPLKDSSWKLAADAGLPEAARPEVEFILGWGRWLVNHDATSKPAFVTRECLSDLHQKAQALLNGLEDAGPRLEFMALVGCREPPKGHSCPSPVTSIWEFVQRIEALAGLAASLKNACDRVPEDKRGDKSTAQDFVTEWVDALLCRHTGHGLTPSQKKSDPGGDFLSECLKLIGVKVKAESMIRKLAAQRRAERRA